MKQEDKELLLKDLCSRLPYKTEIQVNDWAILTATLKVGHISRLLNEDLEIKPYLFPLSSMTDEQEEKYNNLNCYELGCFPHTEDALDYLIENHFDYRGLIDMGLAIDCTNLNIY
jgi:hypothetical protein